MNTPLLTTALVLASATSALAQVEDPTPPWLEQAKLGIFIHWGVYSVKPTGESWPMRNGEISKEDYLAQIHGFTAENYDPESWAALFKRAGADYAVLTAKHHDGVALWNTRANDLSVVKHSPARRDVVGPYCEALRKEGLKVGLYYSLLDWTHPDYNSVQKPGRKATNRFEYQGHDDPEAWQRFLQFQRAQLKELCEDFRPDYLWFDGAWERSDEQWGTPELCDQLYAWHAGVAFNKRIGGGRGAIGSAEQSLPVHPPKSAQWELCMTANDHWGYMPSDTNWKTPDQLIQIFVDTVSMGGKLLFDIGPDARGVIPPEAVHLLEELGRFNEQNREAIWGTRRGISRYHCNLPTTVSNDGKTLYVFLFDQPLKSLFIKGLVSKVQRVSIIGEPGTVPFKRQCGATWSGHPLTLWLELPANLAMGRGRVARIELEAPIKTDGADVGEITEN